jgi:hypothetical protein
VDIGPGSPTGVAFGYGAKFPAKYPGRALHLRLELRQDVCRASRPERRGLHGCAEEFMSASPLPLTDIEVSKKDGAMYVSVGGRKVQSGVYRVTYTGNEKAGRRRSKWRSDAAPKSWISNGCEGDDVKLGITKGY